MFLIKHTSTTNRNLKFWQSMTTEERSVFAEKMHEGQRRMTPAARSERARKGANSQWKNVTDEEKKVRMKNLHKMTPETRKAISDGHQRRKALKLAASL
jgi:hypothetical protein